MIPIPNLEFIRSWKVLKLLGDSHRMNILQHLMEKPATLSQLGRALGMSPARIRHHLVRLEEAGFVELISTNIKRGFIEKYYRASAIAYHVNLLVTPPRHDQDTVLAMGSDDPALDLLAKDLSEKIQAPAFFNVPVGSLDGLIALRQGLCHVAGCHLWDAAAMDYNISFLNKIFPDRDMRVFTVSERSQGLYVRKGNPKNITQAQDLVRPGVTFINRKRGSGTRLWIDGWLEEQQIPSEQIKGFGKAASTHLEVAQSVASGQADVGVGVAAAGMTPDLDFLPLFQERFDLIIDGDQISAGRITRLLDYLQSGALRGGIQALAGYDTALTGTEIIVSAQ